jgi:hypothetical protein
MSTNPFSMVRFGFLVALAGIVLLDTGCASKWNPYASKWSPYSVIKPPSDLSSTKPNRVALVSIQSVPRTHKGKKVTVDLTDNVDIKEGEISSEVWGWGRRAHPSCFMGLDCIIYEVGRASSMDYYSKIIEIDVDGYLNRWYFSVFSRALKEAGFEVATTESLRFDLSNEQVLVEQPPGGSLKQLSDRGDEVRFDWSKFAKERQADLIFALELPFTGVTRDHTAFGVPTSPPRGLSVAIGYLVNPITHQLLWQDPEIIEQPIVGEWDQPPDYPNVIKAILTSLEKAIDQVFFSFFKRAP